MTQTSTADADYAKGKSRGGRDMHRYPLIQRALHWVIAVMVIASMIVGGTLGYLGFQGAVEVFGQPMTGMMYKYHKTFGVIILAAMVIRLIVKVRLGKPDYAAPLTKFEKAASGSVHGLLYLLLIAMPVTGWLATGAGGFPVEFFDWKLPPILGKDPALAEKLFYAHWLMGLAILALIVVHVAAVVKHVKRKDGVLQRMV